VVRFDRWPEAFSARFGFYCRESFAKISAGWVQNFRFYNLFRTKNDLGQARPLEELFPYIFGRFALLVWKTLSKRKVLLGLNGVTFHVLIEFYSEVSSKVIIWAPFRLLNDKSNENTAVFLSASSPFVWKQND
jgi:hypothetical protein